MLEGTRPKRDSLGLDCDIERPYLPVPTSSSLLPLTSPTTLPLHIERTISNLLNSSKPMLDSNSLLILLPDDIERQGVIPVDDRTGLEELQSTQVLLLLLRFTHRC